MQSHQLASRTESWHLVARHEDYVLATWQQVFAVVWRRETTLAGATHLRAACAEFASKNPRGIGLLTIVAATAPLPASPVRKAIAEFLAEGSSFIKCSAVILEGSGFRAAAVRSVVTGLTVLAAQPYPHRVCDIDDAAKMLARVLSSSTARNIDAAAFRLSLDELRERASYQPAAAATVKE